MRHGHISTLHLWPARRPLAASRAAIATALMSDPGTDAERSRVVRKLGGKLVPKKQGKFENGRAVEVDKLEAEGGILWWGNEASAEVDWFRNEIKKVTGGRSPRILDPFSGGGAIPLEALRLGCDVVANDLSPVAWFLLKCTLEYPHRLSGQTHPLPGFSCRDPKFAENFLKAHGFTGARLKEGVARMTGSIQDRTSLIEDRLEDRPWEQASLGWHVRAWGGWVLSEARRSLASRYPTFATFQALHPHVRNEESPIQLVEPNEAGNTDVGLLNKEYDYNYLADPRNPRWVVKPTVAYLWARTVSCKSCRATVPLLKTRWLCKKDKKRVLLEMEPSQAKDGVNFDIMV
ncbi:DUF1156 domain-containing protein, partial [Vibrio parahaemolyticus]|nr:DUF1156 domain-containing protein [Vibrio parahaemolyticus]